MGRRRRLGSRRPRPGAGDVGVTASDPKSGLAAGGAPRSMRLGAGHAESPMA